MSAVPKPVPSPMARIFDGLKVADFTWAAAGPIITKQLADNGATVVKLESTRHPDSIRMGGPFTDNKPGLNRSGFFADFHTSKLSLALDLGHARAIEVVRPLIEWADVVAESFRPGVMKRWGFDYDALRRINPRIVMLSSSLYGADGPWAMHPGYGAQGAALAGIHTLTGWPDRPPAIPKGAYSDSVSPRFGLAALMAALIHREKTGEGQHIELSQIETTLQIVAPELLCHQVSGEVPTRQGNRKPGSLVHGVYPCRGEESWIAIECTTKAQRAALAAVLNIDPASLGARDSDTPDVAGAARVVGAPIDAESVDRIIAERTASHDGPVLMDALRAAGVPAGVAWKATELLHDPVLRARHHYWSLDHPEMGRLDYNGPAYRFEKTPSELASASPCLGEHTERVLRDILRFDDARVDALRADGILG
ncbi:MAG: CoA transferase [Burkholderiaceae bacterium]